jgi:hypothetical protein
MSITDGWKKWGFYICFGDFSWYVLLQKMDDETHGKTRLPTWKKKEKGESKNTDHAIYP